MKGNIFLKVAWFLHSRDLNLAGEIVGKIKDPQQHKEKLRTKQ